MSKIIVPNAPKPIEITQEQLLHLFNLEELALAPEDLEGVAEAKPRWFLPDEDPGKSLLRYMRDIANVEFTGRHLFNFELMHGQVPVVRAMQDHKFALFLGSRGLGKSTLLAFYALWYAVFHPGCKIVVTGAGFRQAKLIIEAINSIVENSPILRSMFGNSLEYKKNNDRCVYHIGDSTITAIPMGDGSTVRGLRAQVVIVDEFASVDRDVFEVVIRGFGVVNQNPVAEIRNRARIAVLKRLNLWTPEEEEQEKRSSKGNKLIIAGTSSWQFNHFYAYYCQYKAIIEAGSDPELLKRAGAEPDTNSRDYCIIRIPWGAAPPGHFDEDVVKAAKNANTELNFNMEFETIFPADSAGFFPRSLIESCTTNEPVVPFEGGEDVMFPPATRGTAGLNYVYGIDPAHSDDSLAVVIVEVHPKHRRVVHCWTINKEAYRERERSSGEESGGYYAYCARKIRNLMKIFPTNLLAIDAQGGGAGLMEAFADASKLQGDEQVLLPIQEGHVLHNGKEHPDEDKIGLHVVELVQFRDYSYTSEANTKLRKDMEDKAILFPYWDQAGVAVEGEKDQLFKTSRFDTYEDLNKEHAKLLDELTTIVVSQTATGMDHWDVPEVKGEGRKKGRMRKDRYSALLMANYAARRMTRSDEPRRQPCLGMAVGEGPHNYENVRRRLVNPSWWEEGRQDYMGRLGAVS